jgi:hypothetical protein
MCSSKPPEPTAPPAPTPTRDIQMDARSATQDRVQRASRSGYQSTMISPIGGEESDVTKSTLGS